MTLIADPRSTYTTTSRRPRAESPTSMYRCSCIEWSGSHTVREKGSLRTLLASSKPTRCFRRLAADFSSSHSNWSAISGRTRSRIQTAPEDMTSCHAQGVPLALANIPSLSCRSQDRGGAPHSPHFDFAQCAAPLGAALVTVWSCPGRRCAQSLYMFVDDILNSALPTPHSALLLTSPPTASTGTPRSCSSSWARPAPATVRGR